MNVRPAESDDRERIRSITRDSLQSSYSLSPNQIDSILDEEFDDEALTDLLDDVDTAVLVADGTVDGTAGVFGFITVDLGARATIQWLHVDPEARGRGFATALFDRVRVEAAEKPIAACILEDAVEGGTFLEQFGLTEGAYDRLMVGGEEFSVTRYEGAETATDPAVSVPESVTVDRDDRIPGREAPFFTVHDADGEEDAYGYFCSQCGSTDVVADGLDRLECGNCGNTHLADEWDDAYL